MYQSHNQPGPLQSVSPAAPTRTTPGIVRWATLQSSFGQMLVAATEKGVCRLSFGEGERQFEGLFPGVRLVAGADAFGPLLRHVVAVVEGEGDSSAIPLDVRGTPFQEACWNALRQIPRGETRSYAQLAAAVGKPAAVRAAGSANGANRVAILIPCHRVIRSDGSLGGYAYGSEIKRRLLERERIAG